MKITYIAKRMRNGEYLCHDVVADGQPFEVVLTAGAPIEKVTARIEEIASDRFPSFRTSDERVVMLDEDAPDTDLEEAVEALPDKKWTNVNIQTWMGVQGIDYDDNDTKAQMLEKIETFLGSA